MPPRTTRWALDDHSRAKHAILREYLNAWIAILGLTETRFLLVDGFAGPGRYTGGEEGSPIIALNAYLQHSHRRRLTGKPYFAFLEQSADRAQVLEDEVTRLLAGEPEAPQWGVESGSFHDLIARLRAEFAIGGFELRPAFVMVDPFGVKDTPFADLEWLLGNPKCELYVSVMISWIARFDRTPEFECHLDGLFGTPDWRLYSSLPHDEKIAALLGLYERRLRSVSNCRVIRFDLLDGEAHKYTIFHASKHELAVDRMKAAIWLHDPSGSFRFGGAQLSLFDGVGWEAELQAALLSRLRSDTWTPVEDLERFLQSDKTRFHSGQLKKTLRSLELAGRIEADPTSRKRVRSYPPGTRLRARTS